MIKYILIVLLVSFSAEADDFCEKFSDKIEQYTESLDPPTIYKVKNNGRLHFYNAPNKNCELKDVFLIHGDRVTGYAIYDGYLYASFFKKDGDDVAGWLKLSGLNDTKMTIRPSSDEQTVVLAALDLIKEYNITSQPEDCIYIDSDVSDHKYFLATISNKNDGKCIKDNNLPFIIRITHDYKNAYTNYGNKSNAFKKLNK